MESQRAGGDGGAETRASLIQKQDLREGLSDWFPPSYVCYTIPQPEKAYLIPPFEDRSDPAILLRGPAAHPRASLQIDQPRELFLFLGGLNRRHQTTHAPGEQSESAFIGLIVVDWNVEE